GEPPVDLLDDLEVGPRLAWDSDEVGCHAERLQVALDGGGLVLAGQPERSDRGADASDSAGHVDALAPEARARVGSADSGAGNEGIDPHRAVDRRVEGDSDDASHQA